MTIQEAVQIADKTAEIRTFGDGFWVKGAGWETKATYSEQRAWELAQDALILTSKLSSSWIDSATDADIRRVVVY